ncbi:MAG: Major facilitator superfamily Symporter family, nucleoside permease, partial [Bacteroidota bacterium]
IIDKYFTINGVRDWYQIWLSFAAYALVIAIVFAVTFKHKHNPNEVVALQH